MDMELLQIELSKSRWSIVFYVETLVFRVLAKMRWWVLSQMFDLSTSAESFCFILQKKGEIWEKLCSIKSNSNKQSARATQKYDD